ncbi:MAG TPA: hypothetical protein VFG35_07655, partial [Actinoplanes sp.]|nr:hypothetical protein [Actinoplanes sp.]
MIATVMAPPPIGYTADQPRQAPQGSERHNTSGIQVSGIQAVGITLTPASGANDTSLCLVLG